MSWLLIYIGFAEKIPQRFTILSYVNLCCARTWRYDLSSCVVRSLHLRRASHDYVSPVFESRKSHYVRTPHLSRASHTYVRPALQLRNSHFVCTPHFSCASHTPYAARIWVLAKLHFVRTPHFSCASHTPCAAGIWVAQVTLHAHPAFELRKSHSRWVRWRDWLYCSVQWFGNMVTMRWWDDLWLNEGFANTLMYFALDAIYEPWEVVSIRTPCNPTSNCVLHSPHGALVAICTWHRDTKWGV